MLRRTVLLTIALAALAGWSWAWTPEENLTPSNTLWLATTGVATASDGALHVIYVKSISSSLWKIYHTYRSSGVFTPAQEVTPLNIKEPAARLIAGPEGRLYVVSIGRGGAWAEYTVFLREWNGASWSSPMQVSDGLSYSNIGSAAIDSSGNLHIVWQQTKTGGEGDIMYRSRSAAGAWGPIRNLTANYPGTSYGSVDPWVACDLSGSGVHVVWHDDFLNNGFQAYYMKSTDGGTTWPGQGGWYQLSTGDYGKAPRVVVDRSNNAHCFWVDRFGGSTNVLGYRKNTGGVWSAPANLGVKSFESAVVDSANVVHVMYSSAQTGSQEMYHDFVSGGGLSGAAELVSTGDNTCKAAFGSLAVDGSSVLHAAWQERKGDCSIGPFILYSRGANAPPPAPVTSFTAAAVSGVRIDLSWRNPTDADFAGTVIRYRFDAYPSGPYDGALLAVRPAAPNSNDSFSHTGLQPGQFVYYGAYSCNTSSVHGPGAFAGARTNSQYNDHGNIGSGSRPFALATSPAGVVYTGTDGTDTTRGTFGRFTPPSGPWADLSLPYTGRVLSLLVHSSGRVYGCQGGTAASAEGRGGVFWCYDPATGQYQSLYTDTTGTQVQGELSEGPDGRIWFGRSNLDVLAFDPALPPGGANPQIFPKPAGISQALVGGIEVTRDNRVYVCWNAGAAPFDLFRLNPATGAWTRVNLPPSLGPEYACNRLLPGNDGFIYGITTRAEGHIFRLDPAGDGIHDYGSQFPAGSWGSSGKHVVGAAWAATGRLYWGSSQDSAGNAHMFYFDRAVPAGSNNGSVDNGMLPTDTRDIHSVAYGNGRVYLGVRQDDSTPRLWSFDVAGTAPSPSIAELWAMPNGSLVTLNTKIVTGGFGDHFYIQEPDRTAGIRVAGSAPAALGSMVSVTGILQVVEGERQVNPTSVTVYSGGNGVPEPLGWNVRAIGGGARGGTPGLPGSFGLNNVGLLGRVAGRVVGLGSGSWFYLDDGSGTVAGEGFAGLRVLSAKQVRVGELVVVTGISSVALNEDLIPVRQIKTRTQEDVRPAQ